MDKFHDEITKHLRLDVATIRILIAAIERYVQILVPYSSQGNKQIQQEIKDMVHFKDYLLSEIEGANSEFDEANPGFLGKNWGKFYDILYKQWGAKNQLLQEKKRTILMPAALEGDEKELEEINDVLKSPVWEHFNRHKTLIDSFYPSELPKTSDPAMQQYINIQTNNGIIAGTNNGQITQNNNKELHDALKELAALIIKENPTDQITQESLENIRDIQTEVLQPYPNKTKLQKAVEGLQILTNLSQLVAFTIQVTPVLHTINQCVTPLLK